MKYGIGNYFSLPNEIFLLGLSSGELAVYSFLKRCENRKTHQCQGWSETQWEPAVHAPSDPGGDR